MKRAVKGLKSRLMTDEGEFGGRLLFKQNNVLEGGKKSEKGDGNKGRVCEGWKWAFTLEW